MQALSCQCRCEPEKELTTDEFKKIVDEGVKLGVKRFYITGGEPFIKEGIFELIRYITRIKDRELIVLTNAMLLDEKRLAALKEVMSPSLSFR